MKKLTLIISLAFFTTYTAISQTKATQSAISDEISEQKSANYKDLLSTFFRAHVDNLLGDKHSYTLNSTFFGLDSILGLSKNASFEKEQKWKSQSLNLTITGDSTNNITKLTGGFTFSLIDKTNLAWNPLSASDKQTLINKELNIRILRKNVNSIIDSVYKTESLAFLRTITETWNIATREHDMTKLHPIIKKFLSDPKLDSMLIKALPGSKAEMDDIKASILSGEDPLQKDYEKIAQNYARKPLWTISPSATYDRIAEKGEYTLASAFTVGLSKKKITRPWELELKGQIKLIADTIINNSTYKQTPAIFSLGANKILMQNSDSESTMEFKFFTQYDHQFGSVRDVTKNGIFTLNTTLRVNIFNSLWLPVTIKYDPDNSNLFSYFSITANLGK